MAGGYRLLWDDPLVDGAPDQREPLPVRFGPGNQAMLGEARSGNEADIVARMGLSGAAKGRPVILVCGGAKDLTGAALEHASAMVGPAVASVAGVTGAVLVDGGTSAGVMRLTGQARARWPQALPVLVGVAPAGLVSYPEGPDGEERVSLEANHSHFILADSSQWGGETRLMMTVAETLAGTAPVVMVLAGGGQVAAAEALAAARRRWPVFAVAGTGGLADSLLQAAGRAAGPPADPALRDILAEADIRPVTGTDPGMFARQLAWELQDEPLLKEAWQRFATYDQLAVRLRRMFTRFQASILILGVVATLLALIENQVKNPALHWVVVVAPILVSVLIAIASRRAFGQRWVLLRAAAEAIKAAIYQYRTLPTAPAARQQQLVSRLETIESRLMQTEASGGPLPPYQGPLPPEMYGAERDDDGLSPLGADRYLQIRVGDQLTYFHRRTRTLNLRRNSLQLLAIASGAAGAILAAANQEAWIGLTAGASAAALAYLGSLQVDNTIVIYNQAASRLTILQRGWRALTPADQDDAAYQRLVASCESALATEQSGWVQQMNETLQDLRRDQAEAADGNGPDRAEQHRR